MKTTEDILKGIPVIAKRGSFVSEIRHLAFDSRKAKEGTLFVAQKGVQVDGHQYIHKAIEKGAVVIVCEVFPDEIQPQITYIQVADSHSVLAKIASNFYDNPSSKLKLIGVTGTNGKTTVASLLHQLFQKSGSASGLLSTVKVCIGDQTFEATHTTPDSLSINRYLAKMVAAGVRHCFMEVSSHGIHQKRTEALDFEGGVFTNLTHDHLDYHNTFLAYRNVKKRFFDQLPDRAFALVNADDKNGFVMLQNTGAKKASYALKTAADFKAGILEQTTTGMLLRIEGAELWVRLIGDFNAYNLLAVFSTARLLGMEKQSVLRLMSELETVSGRFDSFVSQTNILTVVDYAHTPDALKSVLQTLGRLKNGKGRIITVVGCGGNRDQAKRPKMGNIAACLSDQVIFTSDNPRFENPALILNQMESGVLNEHQTKTVSITDRNQALKMACQLAESGDILLIAGKGHERYQEIEGMRHPFDDKKKCQQWLQAFKK